ncbi:BURP domain-containing protein 12-like [Zingiber officinale]|uniref:BURP domain-containing protein n=1 Tax=Zingiber officinale TaxID=94328 RepID=A0A8J5GX87_ZINOF|nr:BURP domain-containing protein 12-like [Zingiber officinale]KAG6511149.1 hypothetical protein ZIOFF_029204 [Zingiber officinale]
MAASLPLRCPARPFLFTLLLIVILKFPEYSVSGHVAPPAPSMSSSDESSNPFSARASLIRYWNRRIPNNRPLPNFLLSKLSPLSALDSATFSNLLATSNFAALSSRLPQLCSTAHLLCSPSLTVLNGTGAPSDFSNYESSNYTNYGTDATAGFDSFKNYSLSLNTPFSTFRRYSRDSVDHNDSFKAYSTGGNIVTADFTSYATAATGGSGEFASYGVDSNGPYLKFTNYEASANGRVQSFGTYSEGSNAGDESFAGYGKGGNGVVSEFNGYATETNVLGSTFTGYGMEANTANDSFVNYGVDGNVPVNTFRSYGDNGNSASESFASYRNDANVGSDTFTSYAKKGNTATAGFDLYGHSNSGSDTFKGYGEGSDTNEINFRSYEGDNPTFNVYSKTGIDFKDYRNHSAGQFPAAVVRHWQVEPGKFFRERDLRSGNVMPMPDIRDRLPARSFLPRSIAERIPFSAADVRRVFGIAEDTALGKAVTDTLADCERRPSRGETKQCAKSAEDMIDFVVEVLGSNAVARSTESTAGSNGSILIGRVKGVNGGNVTKSVSCHQSLFPYLVYYCHSVPRVRVYVAEILGVESKHTINRGVAICHLDTSDWSATHGAFLALGSSPGKIEVCHWIFEGDMTWTVAD